jgi:hypothetical protein
MKMMGKIKEKLEDIREYLENGYDIEDTALILDVPINWIMEVAKEMKIEYGYSEHAEW